MVVRDVRLLERVLVAVRVGLQPGGGRDGRARRLRPRLPRLLAHCRSQVKYKNLL
jgi:hypothetical protein